jgi:hypothetical protein
MDGLSGRNERKERKTTSAAQGKKAVAGRATRTPEDVVI